MARFRGTVQGSRGEAARLGDKKNGLTVRCNGWHSGVTVMATVNAEGNDCFDILATCGSEGRCHNMMVGCVVLVDDKLVFTPAVQ